MRNAGSGHEVQYNTKKRREHGGAGREGGGVGVVESEGGRYRGWTDRDTGWGVAQKRLLRQCYERRREIGRLGVVAVVIQAEAHNESCGRESRRDDMDEAGEVCVVLCTFNSDPSRLWLLLCSQTVRLQE